jgi:hypothetical protein
MSQNQEHIKTILDAHAAIRDIVDQVKANYTDDVKAVMALVPVTKSTWGLAKLAAPLKQIQPQPQPQKPQTQPQPQRSWKEWFGGDKFKLLATNVSTMIQLYTTKITSDPGFTEFAKQIKENANVVVRGNLEYQGKRAGLKALFDRMIINLDFGDELVDTTPLLDAKTTDEFIKVALPISDRIIRKLNEPIPLPVKPSVLSPTKNLSEIHGEQIQKSMGNIGRLTDSFAKAQSIQQQILNSEEGLGGGARKTRRVKKTKRFTRRR